MKFTSLMVAASAVWLGSSAPAAIVSAPWAPDTGSTGEQNLYSTLGFANNSALNTAILNQSGGGATDWTVSTSDAAHYSSLLIEMAGNSGNNEFGIYRTGHTGTTLSIFSGADTPASGAQQLIVQTVGGDTKIYLNSLSGSYIDIGSDTSFGFYLNTHNANGTFYSTVGDQTGGETMQHVVALNVQSTSYASAGQSGYIMGWEDLLSGASDRDYNDMVVSLTALPIPEPTTMIAGALLLLPFGASTLRFVRKNRIA